MERLSATASAARRAGSARSISLRHWIGFAIMLSGSALLAIDAFESLLP